MSSFAASVVLLTILLQYRSQAMDRTPGGVFLSAYGEPQDADGNALEGLPDHLREEEKATCRSAGLVAQKQIDHYGVDGLIQRFGFTERFAARVAGETASEDPPSGADSDSNAEEGGEDSLPDALSSRAVSALRDAGIASRDALEGMTKEALLTINGIGEKTAENILDATSDSL